MSLSEILAIFFYVVIGLAALLVFVSIVYNLLSSKKSGNKQRENAVASSGTIVFPETPRASGHTIHEGNEYNHSTQFTRIAEEQPSIGKSATYAFMSKPVAKFEILNESGFTSDFNAPTKRHWSNNWQ